MPAVAVAAPPCTPLADPSAPVDPSAPGWDVAIVDPSALVDSEAPSVVLQVGGDVGDAPTLIEGPDLNSNSDRAAFMRFDRQIENKTNASKLSAEMCLKLKDKAEKLKVFKDWTYNGSQILELDMLYQKIVTYKTLVEQHMQWLTKDDLLDLFHKKEDIVQEVIWDKSRRGLLRPHPELPHRVDLTQYWCLTKSVGLTGHETLERLNLSKSAKVSPTNANLLDDHFADPLDSMNKQSLPMIGDEQPNRANAKAKAKGKAKAAAGRGGRQQQQAVVADPLKRVC